MPFGRFGDLTESERVSTFVEAMNQVDPFFKFMYDYDDLGNVLGICISFYFNKVRYRHAIAIRNHVMIDSEPPAVMQDVFNTLMDWAKWKILTLAKQEGDKNG